jgi:predicted phage terminase large subunit-like protein
MKNYSNRLPKSLRLKTLVLERQLRRARKQPDEFAEFAFTDNHGRPIRQAQLHRDMQAFLGAHSRALVELPRDHGKSVQACIRILWELGRQPSLRVKIVCASEALAVERSRFIRNAIGRNSRLRCVFPGLRPGQPWTATRFTIQRPAEIIGPSVTAFGVGAASTGARADLLVCDDIVDVRSIHSAAERLRVSTYFRENLVNLLEPSGRLWNLFTPWHVNDLNSELKSNPEFVLFRRGIDEHLTPIWPEKWPREKLEARRREIGEISFARAYRLVPLSGAETPIKPEWIRYWTGAHEYDLVVLSIDPAVCEKATTDATALVVLGRTTALEVHCLAAMAMRIPAGELADLIADLDRRWRPQRILFEANGAFQILCEQFQRDRRFGFKIESVKQSSNKSARVQAFSINVQVGAFRLKGFDGGVAPEQQELYDEMLSFPAGAHDDLLDAAATGTRYLLNVHEPKMW